MTRAGAAAFVDAVEKDLFDYSIEASQVYWVNATYITPDISAMAARVGALGTEKSVKYALASAKYAQSKGLSPNVERKLNILRNALVLPAPTTSGVAEELNTIATDLQAKYGAGKGTLNGQPISGSDIEMGNLEHTPNEYEEMWVSWHDNVGALMKGDYVLLVVIANLGATELDFPDTGAMWRSGYEKGAGRLRRRNRAASAESKATLHGASHVRP